MTISKKTWIDPCHEYLRQLVLETTHKTPCDVLLHIYIDGSMGVVTVSGSGIFNKKGNGVRICKTNLDYCSVFRAEFLAVEEALKFCFTESVNTDIWAFSDSRSSIRHLSEWRRHGDRTTTSIIQLLNSLSANAKIFFSGYRRT
ncbi:RNase H domain-containing protein [Trichonephila clavipes]|nr:RNase H domain-containing protein [Trichonephila clavipes]